MNNDIYHIDFTRIFPGALQHDPKMLALAKGLAAEALTVSGHLNDVLIYSRFDQLPEELVDILAYDMHVDWYNYEDPLEVKRQTVKNSVKVHKRMGTKYAVETAIQAFFPGATVQEWFDYEGEPHHFQITIPLPGGITPEILEDLKRRIWHVKRLSSWLDTIITETKIEKTIYVTPILGRGLAITKLPELEPVMQPMPLYITPTLGDGMAITRLPPLEPEYQAAAVLCRVSAAMQNIMETALPPLEEPELTPLPPILGRVSAAVHTLSETALPPLLDPLQPELQVVQPIAITGGAAIMETKLPTLEDFTTTIAAVCNARAFGIFTTFTETKLPELKEENEL